MNKALGITFAIGAKLGNSVGTAFSSLSTKIKATGTAFGEASRKAKALQKALDLHGSRASLIEQYKNIADKSGKEAQNLHSQLVRVSRQYAKATQGVREHGRSVDDWARAQAALNRRLAQTEERLQGLNRLQQQRDNRREMAGQAAGVAAFGTGLAMPIGTTVRFEDQMLRVAAVSNATQEQYQALTEKAKELGRTTRYTASQVGEGLEYLAMAGFNAKQQMEAIGGVLNVAAAAGINLGTSSDIVSNALTGFGLNADQSNRVGDVLTKTFTNSNTTLASLGETLKYVAPVAKAAGADIEFVAAVAGVMGDAGIQGSMAGTAMRSMFTRLIAPAKQAQKHMSAMGINYEQMQEIMADPATQAAAQYIKKMGISVADSNGDLRDWNDILTELSVKMDNLSEQDRLAAATAIFGKPALSGGLAVLSAMKKDESYLKTQLEQMREQGKTEAQITEYRLNFRNKLHDRYNKNLLASQEGTAKQIANRMESGAGGALRSFASAYEGSMLAFGNAFTPILKDVAAALTTVTNGVTTFIETFPKLSSGIALGVTALTGLAAATLVFRFAFSGISTVVQAGILLFNTLRNSTILAAMATKIATGAQWLLNAALTANPIGVIVMAVAALVGGLIYLYNTCEPVRKAFDAIGKFIANVFDVILKKIQTVWSFLQKFAEFASPDEFAPGGGKDGIIVSRKKPKENPMPIFEDDDTEKTSTNDKSPVISPLAFDLAKMGIDTKMGDAFKMPQMATPSGMGLDKMLGTGFKMPSDAELQQMLNTNSPKANIPSSNTGTSDTNMNLNMNFNINGVTDNELATGVMRSLENNRSSLEAMLYGIIKDQVRVAYGN